jgi:hypothetical protein
MNDCDSTVQNSVVDWLNKLHYVLRNEGGINAFVGANSKDLVIEGDTHNVIGAKIIYEYVELTYLQLMIQGLHAQRRKLLHLKQELIDQLNDVETELSNLGD